MPANSNNQCCITVCCLYYQLCVWLQNRLHTDLCSLLERHAAAVIVAVESDPVARLEIVAKSSTVLHLRWSAPASSNARVEFYVLSYRELELLACMRGPRSWSPLIDVDSHRRELAVPDLLPYCKYEVTLSAYTVAGQGRTTVAIATTDAARKCFGFVAILLLYCSHNFVHRSVHLSVCPSICHTLDPCLRALVCQNIVCTTQ